MGPLFAESCKPRNMYTITCMAIFWIWALARPWAYQAHGYVIDKNVFIKQTCFIKLLPFIKIGKFIKRAVYFIKLP